jgi:pimeloyl-ACP methyl ester carboxylesterase
MRVGDFVTLAHDRLGSGPPLLLLHAFGLSRAAWKPVVPLLAPERELLLVDLPGHGQSPMPPAGTPPNPEGYAREVARLLDELGLDAVDVCGNSIGGWTALELAKQGRASAVVALSPAGLWPRESRYRRMRFLTDHYTTRLAPWAMRGALRTGWGRRLILGEVLDRPEDLSDADARRFLDDFAGVKDLPAHLRGWRGKRFEEGEGIEVPVSVAWGGRDRLMPPKRRSRDGLPAHAHWFEVPDCGHVMAWDEPKLVAGTVLRELAASQNPEPASR